VTNTGDAALEFTAALHTYLAVSSVGHVELRGGFEGCEYLDKLDGLTKRDAYPDPTPNPRAACLP